MMVVILFISLFLTTYTFYIHTKRADTALIWSALVIGLAVALSTEILSLFGLFRFEAISMFWVFYCIVLIIMQKLWRIFPPRPTFSWHYFAIPIGLFLVATVFNALISPPNTYDSMTYHMSRVVFWEQYGSVAHYPTSESRQLYQHPFAEYVIAHLQILSNRDRFANLPQWFSYLGSLILIFTISQQFGANRYQRWGAVVLGATIPMAIVQATSTQNDMVTTYWVLSSIYFALLLRTEINLKSLLGLGVSVGLALLTKGSAYIYLFPLLIWLTLILFMKYRFNAIYKLAIAGTISLIVITPHLLRNYDTFQGFTGPSPELYSNANISISYTTSNILRNIGLNYGSPIDNPFLIDVSRFISSLIIGVHDRLGILVNDPNSTFGSSFESAWSSGLVLFPKDSLVMFADDAAPAPIHVTLLIVACFIVLYQRKFSLLAQYTLICVGTFILFSAILRWQPWHTRLQLPMLMMSVPIIALVLNKSVLRLVATFTIIIGIYWVLFTPFRSLVAGHVYNSILHTPRTQLQHITETHWDVGKIAYEQDCPIGFHLLGNTTVYHFLTVFKSLSPDAKMPQIGYVFVDGAENYKPCVVIANKPLPESESQYWQSVMTQNEFMVWVKREAGTG